MKNWEISAALEIGIAQRLARRLCTRCRELAEITEAERAWIRDSGAVAPDSLWKPVGCDSCAGTGFSGRIGIFEVWRLTTEARTLILHGADEPALKHHAVASGTRLLMVDAIDKAASGLTALSELRSLYWQRATPSPAA